MHQSSKFWDKIADKYAKQPVSDEASYQHKLSKSQEYFKPEMEVLEFGCGTGSTAIAHSPFVKHIHAIDISANMLKIAQSKAQFANITNINFEHTTIKELTVKEASYDAVLGLSILHLLEDKEKAIEKIYQLIKPGGVFISSTVCLGDRKNFLKYLLPIGTFLGLIPLVKVFTINALASSLEKEGFEIDYQWQAEKSDSVFIVAKKKN